MTFSLRSERAPAELTLLIHMGAGAVQTVVNAAVRNYGEYRSVTTDGLGLFTVSVFAIDDSRSENDILAALPQRSFARITVGAVTRAGYGLLPTSTDDPDLPPAVAAIQQVHFDIVLPSLDDHRLATLAPPHNHPQASP